MIVLEYPKCGTCRKALKWLNDNGLSYIDRHIDIENPTLEELKEWYPKSGLPLKKFFNTSGRKYKELKLSEKLEGMTDDEKLGLLAGDGMLVKRPIIIYKDIVLVGFNETEWSEKLK